MPNLTPAEIADIRAALDNAEQSCRYHGIDFGFLDFEPWGEPRCESCRQPWRVSRALVTLTRAASCKEPGRG